MARGSEVLARVFYLSVEENRCQTFAVNAMFDGVGMQKRRWVFVNARASTHKIYQHSGRLVHHGDHVDDAVVGHQKQPNLKLEYLTCDLAKMTAATQKRLVETSRAGDPMNVCGLGEGTAMRCGEMHLRVGASARYGVRAMSREV
jgi:hypothetical protein